MKNFFKYPIYLCLMAIALQFTACQEEFEEIGSSDNENPITANSATAKLIENTTTRDGSFDNIVDGASCFDIKFPYTVTVNNIEITIDAQEDLETIEDIFDELDTDIDILEILFPITITLADFTELSINSLEELEKLANECKEGGTDDDIECIDFVYPITMLTFNTTFEQTGSVTVENDRELRLFFKSLDENELVSFDFPVSLKLSDDTIVSVNSIPELARTIESAKDDCDEDDDDDYNDDDFSDEDLKEELISCLWFVKEFKRSDVDQTNRYLDYIFNFKEDGTVTSGVRGGDNIEGTWNANVGDNGAKLTLDFEASADFTLEWNVYDIGDDKIKLYNGESNRIVMKQICEDNLPTINPDNVRAILKECPWIINEIELADEDYDEVLAYELKFMADNEVILTNGVTTITGTWMIGFNADEKLALTITMETESGLTFEWPLKELGNNKIKFENPGRGYKMLLERFCNSNNTDNDVIEIEDLFLTGDWKVASYKDDNTDETADYTSYQFNFMPNNQIAIKQGEEQVGEAVWRVLRDSDQKLKVYLNFGENNLFDDFTDDWDFVSKTESSIELKDISGGDGSISTLVFEKL